MAERRPLTEREENARLVLRTLMRMLDVPDKELAQRITAVGRPISRSAIQQRRAGDKPLDFRDIQECATALDVPEYLFDQEPAEAVKWLANSAPDMLSRCIGWLRDSELLVSAA